MKILTTTKRMIGARRPYLFIGCFSVSSMPFTLHYFNRFLWFFYYLTTFLAFSDFQCNCIFAEQRNEKVYYILRYNTPSNRVQEEIKMKILAKLRKLETEILKLKGRKREEAMKAYRRLLLSSTDEAIYFMRSE